MEEGGAAARSVNLLGKTDRSDRSKKERALGILKSKKRGRIIFMRPSPFYESKAIQKEKLC
jgi:hypothetical protein